MLAEDGHTTVQVGGGSVTFPRYVHARGAQMSEAQAAAEAAAFAEVDRLLGRDPSRAREPGDDDDGLHPPTDKRTPQQRDQDVDFEARAVKAIARRGAERKGASS